MINIRKVFKLISRTKQQDSLIVVDSFVTKANLSTSWPNKTRDSDHRFSCYPKKLMIPNLAATGIRCGHEWR